MIVKKKAITKNMFEKLCVTSFMEEINSNQAGYIFFYSDFKSKNLEEIKNFLAQFPKNQILSTDFESPSVNRLKDHYSFKDPTLVSKMNSPERYAYFKEQALFLKNLGINLNYSPLVDLWDKNSIMKNRAFSDDTKKIISIAEDFIKAYNEVGILSCIKHFPGHGSATLNQDSHQGLFYLENYQKKELEPFLKLKSPCILSAHVLLKENALPITFDKDFIKQHLKNYPGLLITDDLHMGALLNYSLKERVIFSLKSGHDLLLFSQNDLASSGKMRVKYPEEFQPNLVNQVNKIIEQAIKNGELNENFLLKKIEKINRVQSNIERSSLSKV